MQEIRIVKCKCCSNDIEIDPEKILWDEHGYGYSTKLYLCPECGKHLILEYYEDPSLDINIDTRWYEYK